MAAHPPLPNIRSSSQKRRRPADDETTKIDDYKTKIEDFEAIKEEVAYHQNKKFKMEEDPTFPEAVTEQFEEVEKIGAAGNPAEESSEDQLLPSGAELRYRNEANGNQPLEHPLEWRGGSSKEL